MIEYTTIRKSILVETIRMALWPITNWWSHSAEELLLMIAAHESHGGKFLQQQGGPALGLYGMEPDTLVDNYDSYIRYRSDVHREFMEISGVNGPCLHSLQHNHIYSTLHARLKLKRSPGALPKPYDVQGMAEYAKLHYNSPQGAATPEKYILDYRRLMLT